MVATRAPSGALSKVPVTDPAETSTTLSVTLGVAASWERAISIRPPILAVPAICKTPGLCAPCAAVPPTTKLSVEAVAACVWTPPFLCADAEGKEPAVKLPATCRVLPASKMIVPSLDRSPAVVNWRRASSAKLPWLEVRLLIGTMMEFGPFRVTTA